MSAQEEKWEIAISGRHMDSVRKEILVVFTTGLVLVKGAQSSSSTSKAPTQIDGRKPYIFRPPRGASPSGLKGRKPCHNFLKGKCTKPPCDLWHPPVCLIHKSESGCKYGDKCKLLHIEAGGQPSKRPKKGGAKGSVALLKETCQLGCMSHDSPQRKSILRENGKLRSNHTLKLSKPRYVTQKLGKRRIHRRESIRIGNLRSEFRGLQKSMKERKMRSSGKSGAPAAQPGTWQRTFTNSKRCQQIRSTLSLKPG